MNPWLPALALTGCFVLGVRALALVRDRGPVGRFGPGQSADGVPRRGKLLRAFDRLSDSLAPRAVGMLNERRRAAIRRKLDAAGRPMTLEAYAGRKAAFTVLFAAVGCLFLIDGSVLMFVLLTALGWLWMDVTLGGQASRRGARIERDLPDFLDVLAVTVGAGVGFRPAMGRVGESLGGPLGDEVLTTLRQMDLGASRREALEGLRRRNHSESLGNFVTALLQAEELGVPLAEALTDLAADMRRASHQRARRRAARAAPRVSLITTSVLVPGAVILIVAALFIGSDLDLGALGG